MAPLTVGEEKNAVTDAMALGKMKALVQNVVLPVD